MTLADAVSWTTIGANIATMLGVVGIGIILQLNLNLSLRWQRRIVRNQELAAFNAETGIPMSEGTRDLLNRVLTWSDKAPFARGSDKVTDEYREYVSRLIALFDLVLMDEAQRHNPATHAKIAEVLARHGAVLDEARLRWLKLLPVSRAMASILRQIRRP